MAFTETDIKSLAIQSVDETIQSAVDQGVDLAGAEIVISFEKKTRGGNRVTARLIQNIFVHSVDLTNSSDPIVNESLARPSQQFVWRIESPKWSGRELSYCGCLVKRYRNPGPNQQAVLSAFEEEDWPERIDNPLCSTAAIDAQSRLADTIKSLNRNHQSHLIRFHGDGSGKGVTWRRIVESNGKGGHRVD